jgi:lactate dehydrogenase-like 2-hydroxyacid dehydrogenase
VFAPKLAQGKTIGIIGLGGIGINVATIGRGIGLKILASRRSATERQVIKDGVVDELFPPSELHALLVESDIVVLAIPATAETHRLIDATAFQAMKLGAIFVNKESNRLLHSPTCSSHLTSRPALMLQCPIQWTYFAITYVDTSTGNL